MRRIQGVSVPRSGHGLLSLYLASYYARDATWFQHSQDFKCDGLLRAGDFVYCEMYGHCQVSPCPDPDTTFQKSHDFKSTEVQYEPRRHYLVQTRRPLPAIISHYKLRVSEGMKDSWWNWHRFYRRRLAEWLRFQRKWVVPGYDNVWVLDYDDLVRRPEETVREAIHFIDPDHEVDEGLIARAVRAREPFHRDTVTPFKYYDSAVQKAADRVQRLVSDATR